MDKRNIFRKTGSALTATLATIVAQAQGSGTHVNAESILTGAESTLKSLAGPIINVVSIIMGLVGVGMLGVNLYKYFKGDPTSNDALTKIGGGLLVAVIILQVINYTMLWSGMKCKVYRALDKPQVFFGIKGRFITWYLILAGVVLMLAVIIGAATAGIFGFVLFILGAACAYVFVMLLQDRTSDREFAIRLDARKYPRCYRVRPQPFRKLINGNN